MGVGILVVRSLGGCKAEMGYHTIKTGALAGWVVEMIWLPWQSLRHVTTSELRFI